MMLKHDNGSFAGKVALVTGAASGIGRAAALAFAREGARVIVADVDCAGGEETVQQIAQAGGEARFVHADVSRPADVEALVAATIDAFGRLDVAFNNAGIEGETAATDTCTLENWERVLAINLSGVFHCMQAELPRMLENGGGAIVNCASVAGLVGFPGMPAYVASKHGVVGLTKTAALDYAARGIRVNAICPGVIATPMVERASGGTDAGEQAMIAMEPIGRMGTPAEVAAAAVWLCSPAASFITGEALAVDGGLVAR